MKTQSPEQAEVVMAHFNLTAETFNALPRGLAAELYSMINSHDALVAACKAALSMPSGIARPWTNDEIQRSNDIVSQIRKTLDTINA